MFGRKLYTITILIVIFSSVVYAGKSVFIISNHSSSYCQAYKINGNQVDFQADVDISSYNPGYAVGLATWPEKNLLFVTYEGSGVIVWSSTKTFEKIGDYDTSIPNCSGIVINSSKELIYIMWRDHPDLYVYSFDEANNTLKHEGTYYLKDNYQNYITGWGLALDEENGLLYVTDSSNRVHYYDTNNFDLQGYIDISVSGNDRTAVGIAVDPAGGYLYTGAIWGHNYLVRTQIAPPHNSIETNVGKA